MKRSTYRPIEFSLERAKPANIHCRSAAGLEFYLPLVPVLGQPSRLDGPVKPYFESVPSRPRL